MNLKLNLIFISLFVVFGLVLLDDNKSIANFIPEKTFQVQGILLPEIQTWTLIDKIDECRDILNNSPSLEFVEERGNMAKRQISLCILDKQTGNVFANLYWLDQKDINKANSLRRNYEENPDNLPRFEPVDANNNFKVINNWWNTFNSDWSIERDSYEEGRYIVLADKYLMSNSSLVYPEDRTGQKYSDIVYVPYSPAIHHEEIVLAGKEFLEGYVERAFAELRDAKVVSKAFPGRLVADTITSVFVKNILVNEHSDPRMTLGSIDGGKTQAERVLVRYGTNLERSFRYTVSSAGASGPAQIMPGTYNSMRTGYPMANLLRDTDVGRVDMLNAVKASTLVFDDHLATVVRRVNNGGAGARTVFNSLSKDKVDEVRAMIYNGGPNKYNLSTGGLNLQVRGAQETLGFIMKFRMIRDLKLFE